MQFTDATSKNGILQDIDFLCNSTSASYHILDKTRNVNQAYHETARLIWEVADSWQFDDSNNTDMPKATRTIANASATYAIPTTALRIEQVEIKDADGDWHKLKPLDFHDLTISPEEYLSTAGRPLYYDLIGTKIRLYPPPGTGYVTMSSGMCVRLSRAVTEFTSGSSTSPGFAAPFHRILSVAASLDYEQDENRRKLLIHMRDRLEQGLIKFYGRRQVEDQTRIKPFTKKRWRSYL